MKAQVLHQYSALVARTLSSLVVALLLLFSLDSFGGNELFVNQVIAFLVHNIPTMIALLVTVIGFKQPETAGFLYFLMAGMFVLLYGDNIVRTGPLMVVSFLLFTGGMFVYQSYMSRLLPPGAEKKSKRSPRKSSKRKRK